MTSQLKRALAGDLKEYRGIPFWAWNNFLDEGELCRQIDEMKSAGIGGFIMHARTGLKEEYLGEKWFACIGACLKRARELGMEAWVYDDNGWPSGFAGGRLLANESFRARFLEYRIGAFDTDAFAVFIRQDNGFIRVSHIQAGIKEYHNIYLRISPANTDILDPAVTEAFIAETHEKYYARFPESFGRELAGFFTDEPQYYRWATPYSLAAEREFADRGEDIRDGLIWLFVHGEEGYAFRERYYGTLNELYVRNYYKKLYDWCEHHGCKLTGHSVEESLLHGQMWGGAAVMPTYAFEHIPGIDWLGRECGNELAPRQVGSVAAQLGKKFVLTETFGCSGYDATPKELKSIAEYKYFNGVNKMCHHLYPYSMAGRGKTDHPPVFSPQANWFNGFRTFNEYFARLGYIVGETRDIAEVGIIHPQRDIWLDYIRSEDAESVSETENAFNDLLLRLRKNGITYHLIDENILAGYGSIEGGALRVGAYVYRIVIVSKMRTLATTTYALLRAYTGRLCVLGDVSYLDGDKRIVSLQGNMSLEELLSGGQFGYFCEDGRSVLTARKGDIGEFLFIKNIFRTEASRVHLAGAAERYCALDLETLEETPLAGDDFVLGGAESLILVRENSARPVVRTERTYDITADFHVANISENYLLLDYAQLARGRARFGERRSVTALFEELLREDYHGEISIRWTFTLRDCMPLTLITERAQMDIRLNGVPVLLQKSCFDVGFAEAHLEDALRKGENELICTMQFYQHDGVRFALFDPMATESLKNCLYYDTSVEPVCLKGDFIVEKDFTLAPRKSFPPLTDKLYEEGYPFFKGELTLCGHIYYTGGRAVLHLCGRFMMAEVYANGECMQIILDSKKDISPILRRGNNEMKIVLKSSLRNLFGPHHYIEPEPIVGVNPYCFEFRGAWEHGAPADYTDEYHFVPFGIKKIWLQRAAKCCLDKSGEETTC